MGRGEVGRCAVVRSPYLVSPYPSTSLQMGSHTAAHAVFFHTYMPPIYLLGRRTAGTSSSLSSPPPSPRLASPPRPSPPLPSPPLASSFLPCHLTPHHLIPSHLPPHHLISSHLTPPSSDLPCRLTCISPLAAELPVQVSDLRSAHVSELLDHIDATRVRVHAHRVHARHFVPSDKSSSRMLLYNAPSHHRTMYLLMPASVSGAVMSALKDRDERAARSCWKRLRAMLRPLRLGRARCKLHRVRRFWPHLSIEDPPSSVGQAALELYRVTWVWPH